MSEDLLEAYRRRKERRRRYAAALGGGPTPTSQLPGVLPQEAFPEIEDRTGLGDTAKDSAVMLGTGMADQVVGLGNLLLRPLPGKSPLQGVADRSRANFEETRDRYLEQSPGLARSGVALASELIDPLGPALGAAKAVSGLARAGGQARKLADALPPVAAPPKRVAPPRNTAATEGVDGFSEAVDLQARLQVARRDADATSAARDLEVAFEAQSIREAAGKVNPDIPFERKLAMAPEGVAPDAWRSAIEELPGSELDDLLRPGAPKMPLELALKGGRNPLQIPNTSREAIAFGQRVNAAHQSAGDALISGDRAATPGTAGTWGDALIADVRIQQADQLVGSQIIRTAPKGALALRRPQGKLENFTHWARGVAATVRTRTVEPVTLSEIFAPRYVRTKAGKQQVPQASQVVSSRQLASMYPKGSKAEKLFLSQLPKMLDDLEGASGALKVRGSHVIRQSQRAIESYARAKGKDVLEVEKMIAQHREIGALGRLPEPLRKSSEELGKFQDDLTQQMLDSGMVDPKFRETFKQNKGKYRLHTYRFVNDPDYAAKVQNEAVWNQMDDLIQDLRPELKGPDAADQRAGLMFRMLDRTGDAFEQTRALSTARQKRRVLDGGKSTDRVFQDFLGLEEGILTPAEESFSRMAHDIATHKMLKAFGEAAEEAGVVARRPGEQAFQKLEESGFGGGTANPVNPLQGMYAPPEVHQILQVATDPVTFAKTFGDLNSLVKSNQLLTSPDTHSRNIFGSIQALAASGMPTSVLMTPAAGARMVRATLNKMNESDVALLEKWTAKNVARGGIASGEIGSHTGRAADLPGLRSLAGVGAVKKASEFTKRAYEGPDIWLKIHHAEHYEKFAAPLFGNPKVQAAAMKHFGVDNATDMAAEITRGVMQSYDLTPAMGRALSNNPLVGAYAPFAFESIRNLSNQVRFAGKEIMMGKEIGGVEGAKFVARGVSRVGSTALMASIYPIYAAHKQRELGLDDDFMDAYRESAAAPYNRHASLVAKSYDPDTTEFVFTSTSNTSYFGASELLMRAMATPGPIEQKLGAVADEIQNQFAGPEVAITGLVEMASGQFVRGNASDLAREVLDRNSDVDPNSQPFLQGKNQNRGRRLLETMSPAIVKDSLDVLSSTTTGRNFVESLSGMRLENRKGAKVLADPKEVIFQKVAPTKATRQDISYTYSRRWGNAVSAAQAIASNVKGAAKQAGLNVDTGALYPEQPPADGRAQLDRAFAEADQHWDITQEWALNHIANGRKLGFSNERIWGSFDGKFSKPLRRAWMSGQKVSYTQYNKGVADYVARYESLVRQREREADGPLQKLRIRQGGQ